MRYLLILPLLCGLTACSSTPDAPAPLAPPAEEQARFLSASRREHDFPVTWTEVASHRFDDPAELKPFKAIDGEWTIAGGALLASGGKPDSNRTLLLMPVQSDYLRIEFDATLDARPDGRIGDVCVRFADPETGHFGKYYAVITGQYWNQASVVYRRNIPIARTEWSPLVPGRTHRVLLEFTRDHLRYWIDGKVVLEAWDRQEPVDVKGTWLGISTYDTTLRIDNLTIATGEPVVRRRR